MGFNEQLNDAANGLMNLFFPRKCPFCGGMVQGKELLCGDCRGTLPFCQEIRRGADFGRCAAPLYYEGRVRDAILAFKFKKQLGGLECFGQLMAATAAERGHEVILLERSDRHGGQISLAAVPPHKEDLRLISDYL